MIRRRIMRLSAVLGAFLVCLSLVGGLAEASCPPLPYNMVQGAVIQAQQLQANFNALVNCINNSLVTLSGPLGPIGAFVSPVHQNQGAIPNGTHNVAFTDANVAFGADYLALQTGDQSELHRLTVATPQSGDIISYTASLLGAAGNPYTGSYTVVGGDTATSAAVGACKALLNNASLMAALAAFQPTNPLTIPIGYYPVQAAANGAAVNAGCASQTTAGVFAYDFPWAASVNSIAWSKSGGGTTTASDVKSGLDGSPQIDLGKFIPGRNNAAGDLGPIIFFNGQANSSSTGLDTQIAAISTKWTSSNSASLIFSGFQSGVGTNEMFIGKGLVLPADSSCGGATALGDVHACNYFLPQGGSLSMGGGGFIQGNGSNIAITNNVGGGVSLNAAAGQQISATISGGGAWQLGTDFVLVSLTDDATSPTTGSFHTPGGLGVVKAAWIGGLINVAGAATLQSTLAVAGAATLTGGIAGGASCAVNVPAHLTVVNGVVTVCN